MHVNVLLFSVRRNVLWERATKHTDFSYQNVEITQLVHKKFEWYIKNFLIIIEKNALIFIMMFIYV